MSDNVIRFPDGDYYCPNCGGRWFRLVDPFTSAHTAGTANRYWYGGLTDASWPLLRWNEEASEGFWPWLPF